jgi:hypothetical protein
MLRYRSGLRHICFRKASSKRAAGRKRQGRMPIRKKIPKDIQKIVLIKSARRCCLCYGLNNDDSIKKGQIAHIDHEPSNNNSENLAWLCLDHHDEYDSKFSQCKAITQVEIIEYRRTLHEYIDKMRNQLLLTFDNSTSFNVSYSDLPSMARIRTPDQFVKLSTRSGPIEPYMLDVVKEVLVEIDDVNSHFENIHEYFQQFMVRALWFDKKHGGASIHIDLLYNQNQSPILDKTEIQNLFHDGDGWYGGQIISIIASVVPVNNYSDNFSPLNDEYYDRQFLWNEEE